MRRIALTFPGAEEGTSYGTPAFHAAKKFWTRLKEDGKSIVVRIDIEERAVLIEADPKTYFITEHYRAWPAMLVSLEHAHEKQVRHLLEQSWRGMVTKKMLAAYDGAKPATPAKRSPSRRSPSARRKR